MYLWNFGMFVFCKDVFVYMVFIKYFEIYFVSIVMNIFFFMFSKDIVLNLLIFFSFYFFIKFN